MLDLPNNPYLEQEVLSASPAKLRWMLISKAVQLARIIEQLWKDNDATGQQWTIRLRDVLTELLSGIHGTDELAKKVSDLYVYMLKQVTLAEINNSAGIMTEIVGLLQIEEETWRQVHLQTSGANLDTSHVEIIATADRAAKPATTVLPAGSVASSHPQPAPIKPSADSLVASNPKPIIHAPVIPLPESEGGFCLDV